MISGIKKSIENYDDHQTKNVLPDYLIRGNIISKEKERKFEDKTPSGPKRCTSKSTRRGYLPQSLRDTYSTVNFNKTLNTTMGSTATKNKTTKLVDDDLRMVGVMNTILNGNDPNYLSRKNVTAIHRDRDDAVARVSKGELSKELAMLACLKVYSKIYEKQQRFPEFEFKTLIKDFIVQRNGRLNCHKLEDSLGGLFKGTGSGSPTKETKDKLLASINLEKLKFPEILEIANALKAGLSRDEVLSLCMDINSVQPKTKMNNTFNDRLDFNAMSVESPDRTEGINPDDTLVNDPQDEHNHILVDDLVAYVTTFGPFLFEKYRMVDDQIKMLALRENSILNSLKHESINFGFSTMDYNQFIKSYKKDLNDCILKLFGDPANPSAPESKQYRLEYLNIKHNLGDIDTYISQMKKINTNLINNTQANELFKYYSDSIYNQFCKTKKDFKDFKNFIGFLYGYYSKDPDICTFIDILTEYQTDERKYMNMITDLHTQIKVYIQTRNGDLNSISMKNVAELIHSNATDYPTEIGRYIKVLSKYVKKKRESGELNLETDTISYHMLEGLRQSIKEKSEAKAFLIESYVEKLCNEMPQHVKRKNFNYKDCTGEVFYKQIHTKPSNGSEKLKLKMERMWVSSLTTDLIQTYRKKYERERDIFNKYYSLIVNRDFTFDKQIYMQNVIGELDKLEKGSAILNEDDVERYENLVYSDMDYNTKLIIADLKKENKLNKLISDKYQLTNNLDNVQNANKEEKYWAYKTEKDQAFGETVNNPYNQMFYSQMQMVEKINTQNDPNFNRKKQLENVIRGKSVNKDTHGVNPCHQILSNYVGSQEKELLKMMPGKDTVWYLRPHHIQSVTNHPKSMIDDLCAIQHIDYIQDMYKNKEIEEEQVVETKTHKELKFKREYDKIEDEVERSKRKIIDGINTYAINQSTFVQSEIEKKIEWYKEKQREMEENGVKPGSTGDSRNFMEFKSYQGGGERAEHIDVGSKKYEPRKSVYTDPLRTTKIMSETYCMMLDDLRKREQNLVSKMREKESENFRPPKDRWYELKDKRFTKELGQNRIYSSDNTRETVEERWYGLLENDLY